MTVPPRLHTIVLLGAASAATGSLRAVLDGIGWRIETIENFERAVRRLETLDGAAATVLALQRADDDGADLIAGLAARTPCPTLVLLAEGGPRDRAALLERGAADVLTPPFLPVEIRARLLARWRSAGFQAAVGATTRFGFYTLDRAARSVCDESGVPLPLTNAEFDLLAILAEAGGRPLSRQRLLEATRSRHWNGHDRSIDVLIGRLRRKLETDPRTPRLLLSLRGFGYRLVSATTPPAEPSALAFPRRAAGFAGR